MDPPEDASGVRPGSRPEFADAEPGAEGFEAYEAGRIASVRKRAVTYLPAYAVPAFLGLAVVPVLTRVLGPREFGIYAVCLSIHGCLLSLAADPSTGSLNRFYAMTSGLPARRQLCKALLGLTLALAAGVMVTVLVAVAAGELVADLGTWGRAIAATAVATAAFTVLQYLLAVRYVQERAVAMSLGQVTHSVGKAAGLLAGAFVAGTAAASLACYALVCAVIAMVLVRPVVRPNGPFADRHLWRRALRYGVPLVAMSLSFVALASFDRTVLAGVEGEAIAGLYAAAYLIAEGVVSLPAQLLRSVVFTSVLEAYQRDDRPRARRLIRRSGDAVLLIAAPFVVAFALAGGWIVETISGGEYRVPDAVPALVAAGLVAYRLGSLDSIGFNLVLASGGLARTFVYATLLALPITTVFVVVWGLEGAAAATLVGYVGFFLLIRLRSPVRDITAYPLRRLLAAVVATGAVTIAGLTVGIFVAIVLGALLWGLAFAAVARD